MVTFSRCGAGRSKSGRQGLIWVQDSALSKPDGEAPERFSLVQRIALDRSGTANVAAAEQRTVVVDQGAVATHLEAQTHVLAEREHVARADVARHVGFRIAVATI